MGAKESENMRYLRTVMRPWVLNHLFNILYIAEEQTIKEQAISESEYNDNIIWLMGSGIPVMKDEDFERFKPNEYDINSISGMTEWFMRTMHPSKKKATVSDRLRHICNHMKDDEGILESKSKRSNSYRYYPKEDYDTLKKILGMSYGTDKGNVTEKHILIHSRYYELMVNRQMILDAFRADDVKIRMELEIEGKRYRMEAPVLGRFRKVYEMHPVLSSIIEKLNGLKERMESGDYSPKDAAECLFDDKELADEISDNKYEPEQMEANHAFLSEFIEHLETIRDEMSSLDDLAHEEGCHEGGPFSSIVWFPADRRLMRREALWEELVLSEDDIKELRSVQVLEVDGEVCKPIDDQGIHDEFLEYYPYCLEDDFILPVLCLIELSPKAASRFIEGGHYRLQDSPGPAFVCDDRSGVFGAELDRLLMDALTDVMNGNTVYQFNEYNVEHHRNKTYLYRLGDTMINGQYWPALMTFRVNPGRYLSMRHSILPSERPYGGMMEYPVVTDPFDTEFHDRPLGIPNGAPSYVYLGDNWVTPVWFYDIFIEFGKSHFDYINGDFATLLKGWILTDLSDASSV